MREQVFTVTVRSNLTRGEITDLISEAVDDDYPLLDGQRVKVERVTFVSETEMPEPETPEPYPEREDYDGHAAYAEAVEEWETANVGL